MSVPFYRYTRSLHFLISRVSGIYSRLFFVQSTRTCDLEILPFNSLKRILLSVCLPETRKIRSLFEVARERKYDEIGGCARSGDTTRTWLAFYSSTFITNPKLVRFTDRESIPGPTCCSIAQESRSAGAWWRSCFSLSARNEKYRR